MTLAVDAIRSSVDRAAGRIESFLPPTPLIRDDLLSRVSGASVYLKLENRQPTGSFKVRGAFNRLLVLSEDERRTGVIAASTGNHGAAVALAMSRLGIPGLIYVPEEASAGKVAVIRGLGAEVRVYGRDCVASEVFARTVADREGRTFVSPYNDPEVIAGQGTIAREIEGALGLPDAVFASLGGGGMISGIGGYFYDRSPQPAVVACSPEQSPVLAESLRAGQILEMPALATLSDGTAGGVEPGAITFDLCRQVVDRDIRVTEEEIAAAMRAFMDRHEMPVEGAAGVALAGFEKVATEYEGRTVVIVVCGGNVSDETLRRVTR